MIGYLNGTVLKKTDKDLILNLGNIGYTLHCPKKDLAETFEGSEKSFFIHHIIREDASDLYGFANYSELTFFKQLIAINGIGPKAGLEIINMDPEKVKAAILNEDTAFICKTPGVGPKSAKRLILELKDKVTTSKIEDIENYSSGDGEAAEALTRLGYQRYEINRILKEAPKDLKNSEELITYFLKNI